MARAETRDEVKRREEVRGSYKAYDRQGTVIWEDKDFIIGVSQLPPGLSIGMRACQIKDGKTVLHQWDPDNMFAQEDNQ